MVDDIQKFIPFAQKACSFLTNSPDPFHAVYNSSEKLEAAGYVQLSTNEAFLGKIKPGGKYFYTINKTSLVAFAVGPNYKPSNGFKIIGGHTDSPNLKVKPKSKRATSGGCIQLGVECYGGGLWHTWFDRDLGISGRVLVRAKSGKTETIEQHIVKIDQPVARVSTLCIHLQTGEERAAFKFNKEDHLTPIISTDKYELETQVKEQLTGSSDKWANSHEPYLLSMIAEAAGVNKENIVDFELNLFDTQPAALGGTRKEFLYSGRLDNLATCFVSVEALIKYSSGPDFKGDSDISLLVLFDHEEVGSNSTHGAGSPIIEQAVKRISSSLISADSESDLCGMIAQKSFVLSVDQAHAIHPNYAGKHEKHHAPQLNGGIVIKRNQNQRYATTGISGFIIRELCRKAKIEQPEEFVVRNDCACGSTIGPIISAKTGIRTVDIGMPQLSMHSCREVMGIADLTTGYELFMAFFRDFRAIDESIEGDSC